MPYNDWMSYSASFGPFVLDRETGLLTRNGTMVPIGARATALLAALVAAEGRVVAKDVLMEAAWPGVLVEENNLSVQIASLRRAMGRRPDGQDWVITVPRIGYRLANIVGGETEELPDSPPLVAVMSFTNLGEDKEQKYFADGVVDDIKTGLSRFRSFAVIAPSMHWMARFAPRDFAVCRTARKYGQQCRTALLPV